MMVTVVVMLIKRSVVVSTSSAGEGEGEGVASGTDGPGGKFKGRQNKYFK